MTANLQPAQGFNDFVLGSLAADNVSAPFDFDLSRMPLDYDLTQFIERVEDQGGTNKCLGEAVTTLLERFQHVRSIPHVELSAVFAYNRSLQMTADAIGHFPADEGTSAYTMLASMTRSGVCSQTVWPDWHGYDDEPDMFALAEGQVQLVGRYERIGRSSYNVITGQSINRDRIADLMVAIYCGMPVLACFPITTAFFNVTGPMETHPAQGGFTWMNAADTVGNHGMVIVGWRTLANGQRIFITQGSYGPGWADGGFIGIPESVLQGKAFDLFTVREFCGVKGDIPLSLYIWREDCQLRDGRYVSVDVEGIPGQVFRLYQAAFARAPDESGFGFWIRGAQAGLAMLDMAAGFMSSPEFQAMYGEGGNVAFVTTLYRNVLGREPDAGGLSYWTNLMAVGTLSRAQVLLSFADSGENRTRTFAATHPGMIYM